MLIIFSNFSKCMNIQQKKISGLGGNHGRLVMQNAVHPFDELSQRWIFQKYFKPRTSDFWSPAKYLPPLCWANIVLFTLAFGTEIVHADTRSSVQKPLKIKHIPVPGGNTYSSDSKQEIHWRRSYDPNDTTGSRRMCLYRGTAFPSKLRPRMLDKYRQN